MLIIINDDNKMNMKRDNVRIVSIILDLHGVIVHSRKVVLFEYENITNCKINVEIGYWVYPQYIRADMSVW